MESFAFTLTLTAIVAGLFLAWLYTKPGQRWLDSFK